MRGTYILSVRGEYLPTVTPVSIILYTTLLILVVACYFEFMIINNQMYFVVYLNS